MLTGKPLDIAGNLVPLDELQDDINAAKEKGLQGQLAFMPETVQALLDRVHELETVTECVWDGTQRYRNNGESLSLTAINKKVDDLLLDMDRHGVRNMVRDLCRTVSDLKTVRASSFRDEPDLSRTYFVQGQYRTLVEIEDLFKDQIKNCSMNWRVRSGMLIEQVCSVIQELSFGAPLQSVQAFSEMTSLGQKLLPAERRKKVPG